MAPAVGDRSESLGTIREVCTSESDISTTVPIPAPGGGGTIITTLHLDELLSWVADSEPRRARNVGAKADLRRANLNRADLSNAIRSAIRSAADPGDEIRSEAREPLPG